MEEIVKQGFKKQAFIVGILLLIGFLIITMIYFYNESEVIDKTINKTNVESKSRGSLEWNNVKLNDSTIYDKSANICTADRYNMNIVVAPCNAPADDGKNVIAYLSPQWNGNQTKDISWAIVYDYPLDDMHLYNIRYINKTIQVNESTWVNNYLVDRITSYTNLTSKPNNCDLGNLNNTQFYRVNRTYTNGSSYAQTICFTDRTIVNSTAFRISGYADTLQDKIEKEQVQDDITNIAHPTTGLNDGRAYYLIRATEFSPHEKVDLKLVFTPHDSQKSGKWHILAWDTATGLINSIANDQYLYIDPYWNSSFETNLVSVWQLNESSGNFIDGKNGNDNLTNLGADYGATGKYEKAAMFVASNKDWATAVSSSDTAIGTGGKTISVWVNATTLSGWKPILHKGNLAGTDGSYDIAFTGDKARCNIRANGLDKGAITTIAVTAGTWNNIVCVFSDADDKVMIYVNGVNDVNQSAPDAFTNTNTLNFSLGRFNENDLWFDGIIDEVYMWNDVKTGAFITSLYGAGAGTFYGNTSSAPTPVSPEFNFKYQSPSDITSTNIANTTVTINYNITGSNLNSSTVDLFWLTNGTANSNYTWIINGSIITYGFRKDGVIKSNNTDYNFTFVLNDNIYPAVYNLNVSLYENNIHYSYNLTTDNTMMKTIVLNMSSLTKYNFLEFAGFNISSSVASLRIYYCNSTYTTGNVGTSGNCGLVGDIPANQPINHIENSSRHYLVSLVINTTTNTLGNVRITPYGYFVWRGRTTGWGMDYVTPISRTDSTQVSTNSGVGWSNLAGSQDTHIHQFSDDETFRYYVCGNLTTNGMYNCSTTRTDTLNQSAIPPSNVIISSPNSTANYTYIIPVWYSNSISPVNNTITKYNISLYNQDDTFNMTLNANNGINTNWTWNNTNISFGTFNIHVYATDSDGLYSLGESQDFNISATFPSITNVSVSPASPITYETSSTFDCTNTASQITQMYINGVNKTTEKGVALVRGAGTYNINCSSEQSGGYNASSDYKTFTINQKTQYPAVNITPSAIVNYTTQAIITGYNCSSQTPSNSLNFNGLGVANPYTTSASLVVQTYTIIYSCDANNNYTDGTKIADFEVTKLTPSLGISISPQNSVINGTSTIVNGTGCTTTCELRRNGVLVSNPDTQTLPLGSYVYNYSQIGSANYNEHSVTSTLIVSPVTYAGTNGTINFTTGNLTSSLNFEVPYHFTISDYMNLTGILGLNSSCYQETANVSTSCGGLSTGKYDLSVNDYYYVNYTRPTQFQSALWVLKHGNPSQSSNYSVIIPNDCFNNTNIALRIAMYNTGSYGECYNGTSWKMITNNYSMTLTPPSTTVIVSSSKLYDGDWNTYATHEGANWVTKSDVNGVTSRNIYEEGIYWLTYTYPLNVNVSIGNSQIFYNLGNLTTNNRTNNFYSQLNSYLSTCTFVAGRCLVPITFTSATTGLLNYSDVVFSNMGFIENNQTYTAITYEGTSNRFSINISYDNSSYSAVGTLVYNNTNYTGTKTGNSTNVLFYVNVTAPDIISSVNKSFYWVISLANSSGIAYYNSTTYNQTIQPINMSTNCTGLSFTLMNITNYDEETFLRITEKVDYIVTLKNGETIVSQINGTKTGYNFSVCTSENLSTIGTTYSVQLRYQGNGNGYLYKTYNIQNNPTTNIPIYISLYNILNQTGTPFIINYVDFNYLKHPNAIIQVQRQYLETNTYNVVEIPLIASDGTAKATFNRDNIKYKLIVIENGEIIDIFPDLFPECQNIVLGTCELNLRGAKTTTTTTTNDFTYTFSKSSSYITLTYIIPSGTPKQVTLKTNQNSRFLNDVSTCSSFAFSSGGTLTCPYNQTVGDSEIKVEVDIDGEPELFGDIPVSEELNDTFLGNNYFIAFILILSLTLMFVSSGIFKLISAVCGVIFLGLIFLIKGVSVGTIASSLGWLIVAIILAIYEINKHEENYI